MNPLLRKVPLMRTCKEVTALVVAREDRELSTSEQLMLAHAHGHVQGLPTF